MEDQREDARTVPGGQSLGDTTPFWMAGVTIDRSRPPDTGTDALESLMDLGRRTRCQAGREPESQGGRLGPVDHSFRALSGRLKLTARRHECYKASLSVNEKGPERQGGRFE